MAPQCPICKRKWVVKSLADDCQQTHEELTYDDE